MRNKFRIRNELTVASPFNINGFDLYPGSALMIKHPYYRVSRRFQFLCSLLALAYALPSAQATLVFEPGQGWVDKPDASQSVPVSVQSDDQQNSNGGVPNQGMPNGPSIIASQSASDAQKEFDEKSSLDDVKAAVDAGNASAEYQLAERLINEQARSEASSEVLKGAESDMWGIRNQLLQGYDIQRAKTPNILDYDKASNAIEQMIDPTDSTYPPIRKDGKPSDVIIDENGNLMKGSENGSKVPLNDFTNYTANFESAAKAYIAAKTSLSATFSSPLFPQFLAKKKELRKLFSVIVTKEKDQALKLLQASANQGYLPAILELSSDYATGINIVDTNNDSVLMVTCVMVPKDEAKSFEYAQKASNLESSDGMVALALCYLQGKGVALDIDKGMSLVQKAYAKGNLTAYLVMSRAYSLGASTIAKDPQRAYISARVIQIVLKIPTTKKDFNLLQLANQAVIQMKSALSAEDLLEAESKAEDKAKSLRALLFPEAPPIPFVASINLTKDEWKVRLGKINQMFAMSGTLQMSRANFIKACGEPDKTQTVGDDVYWYYSCKDGDMQLVLVKVALDQGQVFIHKTNDFSN